MLSNRSCHRVALIAAVLLITVVSSAFSGQFTEKDLRANEALYYWGESVAQDPKAAKARATDNLKSKIFSISITQFEDKMIESKVNGKTMTIDSTHVSNESISVLPMIGLNYITEKAKKKRTRVIAYMKKSDFWKGVELQKTKVRDYYNSGKEALNEGKISRALKNFYWGYLLSNCIPDTLQLDKDSQTGGTAQLYLKNQISKIFEGLEAKVGDPGPYIEADLLNVPVDFFHDGKKIEHLEYSYYSGSGQEYREYEGFAEPLVFYEDVKSRFKRTIFTVEYFFEHEMSQQKEIYALQQKFRNKSFKNHITLRFILGKDVLPEDDDQPKTPPQPVQLADTTSKKQKIDFVQIDSTNASKYSSGFRIDPTINVSPSIEVIADIDSTKELLRVLKQYQELDIFRMSTKRSELEQLGGRIYIAAAKPDKVTAILFVQNDGTLKDISSGKVYEDLMPTFKGNYAIWFNERGAW